MEITTIIIIWCLQLKLFVLMIVFSWCVVMISYNEVLVAPDFLIVRLLVPRCCFNVQNIIEVQYGSELLFHESSSGAIFKELKQWIGR